ncbi:radical SAM/SPASM domain-containing protein [Pseudoruminococcus massiliensis]|uniref:radical SAM/SPASM domain-containing protein n=1 Tax=Pseudoruminococcus massiliensis TaxID=2086583 RepID=UPI00307C2C32
MNIKTVYIEITNQCNFNCRTCYNRSGRNLETREISVQTFKNIISIFSRYGANRYLLSGGEPTLHSEFDAILDVIEEHPELSFGLVTNGSCRNPRLIDVLKRSRNISLQISLDGSCEEENAKTRGTGHFIPAIEFIRLLSPLPDKPLLKMVISKLNLSDVENFYRLAVSLDCIPEYAFIYRSGNGMDGWDDKSLSAADKSKVLNLIEQLNVRYGISAFLPLCTTRCLFVNGMTELSLSVKTDGFIQPCQSLYHSDFSLGNIFAFDAHAFSQRVDAIYALAKERTTRDYGCAKCILREGCGKGCMAEAYHLSEDPLGNDGNCMLRKIQFIQFNVKKPQ